MLTPIHELTGCAGSWLVYVIDRSDGALWAAWSDRRAIHAAKPFQAGAWIMHASMGFVDRFLYKTIKPDASASTRYQFACQSLKIIRVIDTMTDKNSAILVATSDSLVRPESMPGKEQPNREFGKKGFFAWFDPNDGPLERRVILKLDFFILTYAFIGFWVSMG